MNRAGIILSIACVLICPGSLSAQSQKKPVRLLINTGVDTSNHDISEVIRLWGNYLNSNPDSVADNPYWLTAEKKMFAQPDLVDHTWWSPSLYTHLRINKPTVLSVSQLNNGFRIRTLFGSAADSGYAGVAAITEIAAKKEGEVYRLCNILPYNTASWGKETIGSITFHFPADHAFNTSLAEHMNRFVDSLRSVWHLEPVAVDYYFAGTKDSMFKALGYDYLMTEGNIARPGGYTQVKNRLIISGGSNEWYPHEFVHIYINPHFPKAHSYFSEGYATLLGGSRGHDLEWHIRRTEAYLTDHPDVDLLNLNNIDYTTSTVYVVGGLICRMAEEKGGVDLIKKLLGYGNEDEDFRNAMNDVFGVDQKDLNQFIKAKISEYAKRP
jgi:hypothetical protein